MWQAIVPGIIALLSLTLLVVLFAWDRRRSARLIRDSAAMILRGEEQARAEVASELHDDLGNRLYSLQLRLAAEGHSEAAEVGSLVGLVRQTARRLYPPNLQRHTLVQELGALGRQAQADWGVQVALELTEDCPVEDEIALALYRVAQEALANVHKHGRASAITISLQRSGNGVMLVVEDDGIGINERDRSTTGVGVRSMAERIRAVGGRFSIEPVTAGRGSRVRAEVPG